MERVRVVGWTMLSWSWESGDVLLPGLQVILVTFSSLISHLTRCSVFCCLVIYMSKTEQRWSGAWQGSITITKIWGPEVLEQASSEQYVNIFSLEIPEVKISWLQGCSGKAFPYAQLVLSFFLLPVLSPCQESDLGLHRLLVWPSIAVLMFLYFVMLTPPIFKIYWRGWGTLKSSHSS